MVTRPTYNPTPSLPRSPASTPGAIPRRDAAPPAPAPTFRPSPIQSFPSTPASTPGAIPRRDAAPPAPTPTRSSGRSPTVSRGGSSRSSSRSTPQTAQQNIEQGQELTATQQFELASGVKPTNIDSLNQAIQRSSQDPQVVQQNLRALQQYNTQAEQYQSSLRRSSEPQRQTLNPTPSIVRTPAQTPGSIPRRDAGPQLQTSKQSDAPMSRNEPSTPVSAWAESISKRQQETNAFASEVRNRPSYFELERKDTDGPIKATAKASVNIITGITQGMFSGTTEQQLQLTAEKALFNIYAGGVSVVNPEVREKWVSMNRDARDITVNTLTPIDTQTYARTGQVKFDPDGTATLLTVGLLAGAKTSGQIRKARADPTYQTPGAKTIDASKAMLQSKEGAVKGARGVRKSPLSKPQLQRQSAGLSVNKQGQLRFNQGEFVQKAPKQGGVQQSIRFNPKDQVATIAAKSKNVRVETRIDSQGQVSQDFVLGKQPQNVKPFSRPPSQIKTNRPIDPNSIVVIEKTGKSGLSSLQQQYIKMQQQSQQSIIKNPRAPVNKGVETPQGPTSTTLIKTTNQQGKPVETPIQARAPTGREAVRAKLLERVKEQKRQLDLARKRQQESMTRDFDSNVDLSQVKFLQEPKVVSKPMTPLQVLETPGKISPISEFSTQSMLEKGQLSTGLVTSASLRLGAIQETPSIASAIKTRLIPPTLRMVPELNLESLNEPVLDQKNTLALTNVQALELNTGQVQSLSQDQILQTPQIFRTPSRSVNILTPVTKTPNAPQPKQPQPPNKFKMNEPRAPQPPRITQPKRPKPPEPELVKKPLRFEFPSARRKDGPMGFNVFTRKAGQVVQINRAALTKEEAVRFGQFVVGNTARASFRLEEAGRPATGTFKGRGRPETFDKKDDGWFVEKNKFRISSPGELKEITQKGIFASQQKRKSIFGGK